MIEFMQEEDKLILSYQTEHRDVSWIDSRFETNDEVIIKKCFSFSLDKLYTKFEDRNSEIRLFVIGRLYNDYFEIDKEVLGIENDLLLSKDININIKSFVATGDISIFQRIDQLVKEPIVIGGSRDGAIPYIDFRKLLKLFPTKTTLTHFANARITGLLKDYFETITDAQVKFEEHLSRMGELAENIKANSCSQTSIISEPIRKYELEKYEYLLQEMELMLKNYEAYTEHDWQEKILQIILLIFPKYSYVLKELKVKDYCTKSDKPVNRKIDIALIDFDGNLDIIEIKKPFPSAILSEKPSYRDNYIPRRDLLGSVMQVEKYILYLQKWGKKGEIETLIAAQKKFPKCSKISITNPKGMIIIGRNIGFSSKQKLDFEVIRRKYSNIVDIITYDDLIQRLKNIITRFEVTDETNK